MTDLTLVTVHGFVSSPRTWERLVAVWSADERLRSLRIHPFEYRSPKMPRLPLSPQRIPDYDDIAQTLASTFTAALADAPATAFVTHSQGGLIVQRFLAWMLQQGRGRELSRIVSVIMLACPNNGSDYVRTLRHAFGYRRHPQAGDLEMLNRRVADTQRTVLRDIVNTDRTDDHRCRIPFHVYAGDSDRIVVAASAQSAFPGASTLAGNHASILDPSAPGNTTADVVRYHLLADHSSWRTASPSSGRAVPQDSRGPGIVEGLMTSNGDITVSGTYVAGHDIRFDRHADDEQERSS
ncbi:alpha/beta fold hydrolase [Plantactinospora sp. B5E13]|uniref:alpha/beta fold hydrolase n=1 Tax=unclassified Plantactinospora TaxID=2631981 RepID=UPI00325EA602